MSLVECDPAALVRDAVERVQELAARDRVAVKTHVACGAVQVRPRAWSTALRALVLEAVRACGAGDAVFVHVSDVGDGETLWEVQDTGWGISSGTFDTVGRASAADGFALARAVVDEHRGLLRVESSFGIGTAVSILLPSGMVG